MLSYLVTLLHLERLHYFHLCITTHHWWCSRFVRCCHATWHQHTNVHAEGTRDVSRWHVSNNRSAPNISSSSSIIISSLIIINSWSSSNSIKTIIITIITVIYTNITISCSGWSWSSWQRVDDIIIISIIIISSSVVSDVKSMRYDALLGKGCCMMLILCFLWKSCAFRNF